MEKNGLCSKQLAGHCCKAVHQSTCHLNGAGLFGAMEMAKSFKEGTAKQIEENLGWKVAGSKLGASKGFSLWNLRYKSTLPLVICMQHINSCAYIS